MDDGRCEKNIREISKIIYCKDTMMRRDNIRKTPCSPYFRDKQQ